MKLDTLFLIVNNSVIPAWVLLWVAPRWKWTQRLGRVFEFTPVAFLAAFGASFAAKASTDTRACLRFCRKTCIQNRPKLLGPEFEDTP